MALPKYAKYEIERRWLVAPEVAESLEHGRVREIEDLYVPETGLRLRRISEAGARPVFKFCKKYCKASLLCESVTNLFLSEGEYLLLRAQLDDQETKKKRNAVAV